MVNNRVMITTFFTDEAEVWINPLKLYHNVTVAGLSPVFPTVHCNQVPYHHLTTVFILTSVDNRKRTVSSLL